MRRASLVWGAVAGFAVSAALTEVVSAAGVDRFWHEPARQSAVAGVVRLGSGTCVVRSGTDELANGAALREAVTDPACGLLVKALPGTYDIGATSLPFGGVTRILEGSGEASTTILGQVSACGTAFSAVIVASGGGLQELRSTNVRNVLSGAGCSQAVVVHNGARMSNVTTSAQGGDTSIAVLIQGNFPSPFPPAELHKVRALAAGAQENRAIAQGGVGARLIDVVAGAVGGTINYGLTSYGPGPPFYLDIQGSRFSGSTASIAFGVPFIGGAARIAHSQLDGPIIDNFPLPNSFRCFDVYDASFAPVTCP